MLTINHFKRWLYWIVLSWLLILCGFLCFSGNLYMPIDGLYYQIFTHQALLWSKPFENFVMNPFQGLGNIFIPVNPWFYPGYLISLLMEPSTVMYSFSYSLFALPIIFSFYYFCRKFSFSKVQTITAIVFFLITTLFTWQLSNSGVFFIVPHLLQDISYGFIILCCWYFLGKGKQRENIFYISVLFLFFLLNIISDTAWLPVSIVVWGLFGICFLFSLDSKKELIIKLYGVVGILFLAWITGAISMLANLSRSTARLFFEGEIYSEVHEFGSQTTSVLSNNKPSEFLVLASILGAFLALKNKNKPVRVLAKVHFIFVLLFLILDFLYVQSDLDWNFPCPSYYEYYYFPFYFIFASYLFCFLCERFNKFFQPNKFKFKIEYNSKIIDASLVIFLILVCGFLIFRNNEAINYYEHSKITQFLSKELSPKVGDKFSGYLAGFVYSPEGELWKTINYNNSGGVEKWAASHVSAALFADSKNTYERAAIWQYGIPTVEEYNPFITPSYYLFTSRFLNSPKDYQSRNLPIFTEENIPSLEALGVHYIVTSRKLESPRIQHVMTHEIKKPKANIYLYELNNWNYGQFSPTEPIQISTAKEAIDEMLNPNFSFQEKLLTEENFNSQKLQRSEKVNLLREKNSIIVHAESKGNSIILLPLQYTHCLKWNNFLKNNQPKIFRANILWAALLFNKKIDGYISHESGMIRDFNCIGADYEDYKRLKFSDLERLHKPELVSGRRIILLKSFLNKLLSKKN